MQTPQFLFTVCQRGAEAALKQELAAGHAELRFAYSRPGFVTFKLPPEHGLAEDFELRSTFARTAGFSSERFEGDAHEDLAEQIADRLGDATFDHLHVWQRDGAVPGNFGFEPGETELARTAGKLLTAAIARATGAQGTLPLNRVAKSGDRILDCVLVEPGQWWIGFHRARSMPSRWPGGVPKIAVPEDAVSRAYLKMSEALLWSRLPIRPEDRCVELGSSPGGSCQALLDRELIVTGIDPAEMNPLVSGHPRFQHLRARAADLPRREFRKIKWLMADSNVAPKHTLDSVEHIVTNRQVNVRGMLLTLKLIQWQLAECIPDYLERIRSWGYRYVSARQLAFNRQEICVAALRSRSWRRAARRN